MAKFTTQWHRFKTVNTSPVQPESYSTNNIIKIGEGQAILSNVTDTIILEDPTYIDNSETELLFSDEIPSNAIITGIQYTFYLDADNSNNSRIDFYPRVGTTDGTQKSIFGTNIYGGATNTYPTNISDNTVGLNLDLDNVDNIQAKWNFALELSVNNFYINGYDFEDANGPSPAVRLEYELRPKVTITTGGKLSITQGKMHIV